MFVMSQRFKRGPMEIRVLMIPFGSEMTSIGIPVGIVLKAIRGSRNPCLVWVSLARQHFGCVRLGSEPPSSQFSRHLNASRATRMANKIQIQVD